MKKIVYLCGPTVYNHVHIGNMRPIVTFDIMMRALKLKYPNQYHFIHNITDIDDKIIKQASLENITEEKIAEKYTKSYIKELENFNVTTIDKLPKVTDEIEKIKLFISKLIEIKVAYILDDGVYFDTSKKIDYGILSGLKKDNKDNETNKKNKEDFALWKFKTEGKTWNFLDKQGRPGWHTECAVFIDDNANHKSLDIHGGGIDLKFPHHENEKAQYEILNNTPITHKWVHIGVINNADQKMSKSIGNVILAKDFIAQSKYSSDIFRMIIINSSTGSEINFNEDLIKYNEQKINQIMKIINWLKINKLDKEPNPNELFIDEISNLNFSKVSLHINQTIKDFNKNHNIESAQTLLDTMYFLGFPFAQETIEEEVFILYQEWNHFKNIKNFELADQKRKELFSKIIL